MYYSNSWLRVSLVRWKTRFTNNVGEKVCPIYLVEKDMGYGDTMLDLECEHEIPALAWHYVYEASVREFNKERGHDE